ncbi:MAG TPA: outer membrane protein transport protein [Gemmata sp.]|nr:outer membrane protein transport protein [Gemmata sp.]
MRIKLRVIVVAAIIALTSPSVAKAQGLYLPGAGAIQGGMGGASTATPLDAIGALYWNPAAIGQLGHNEVSIGGNVLFPDIKVSSSFPGPGGTLNSGSTTSNSGVGMASSIGVVYQQEDNDRLTYGMGLFTLGGGGVNFPGAPGNPILSPTGPLGKVVLGPIESSMTILQISPTVSYRITDRLTVGIGPTIDVALASFDPAFFGRPSLNGSGQVVFPNATTSEPFWGGGFRAGLVYSPTDTLDIGFGYTSPQWFQTWQFNARDLSGNPQTLSLNPTLPAIYSLGFGWKALEGLLLALDLRYFDYADARLFGTAVKDGGLGWDSVFSVALGANYQVNDRIAIRAGYQYNTNPLASTSTLFNIQAPAILQNTISVGTTVAINSSISASLGYAYSFQNSITGTAEQIPGAGIKLSASNQSLLFNIAIKFGGPWNRGGSSGSCD